MNSVLAVLKRELKSYFATPIAYVFIVIFLALAGATTFYFGGFFNRGQADLQSFFSFHPWLYLFLIPAVGMRLWAEERKSGTIELLMTLPISTTEAVSGKFVAAWLFTGIALLLTFPIWITVNYLGSPDNGVIFAGYVASFLMAGAYLSIGAAVSALTKSQVTAFVISVVIAFVFTAAGWPLVLSGVKSVFGTGFADIVGQFSFLSQFEGAQRGVLELRAVIFFLGFTTLFALLNGLWASRQRLGA